jgi:uncharacterized protein YndB with AHSA1/START domain
MANKQTVITKDASKKKLLVVREFDAPLEQVWKAWTDSKLLDSWWAPRPWKAETKIKRRWLMALPDDRTGWPRLLVPR